MKTIFKNLVYLLIFGVVILFGVKDVNAKGIAIDEINITGLTQPKAGQSISDNQASITKTGVKINEKGWTSRCSDSLGESPTVFSKCSGNEEDWSYTLEIEAEEGYELVAPTMDIMSGDYEDGTVIKFNNTNIRHNYFQNGAPHYFIFNDGIITISLDFKCGDADAAVEEPEEYTYEVLEGENPTYTIDEKDNTKEVSIRINGDYSLLDQVIINGDVLERDKDYTAREGSTIITLTDEYLSSLDAGDYQIEVSFTNQEVVTTSLRVEEKQENTSNPATFDGISTSIILFTISLFGFLLSLKKLKLRKN